MDEKSLQSQGTCNYKGDCTCHVEFFATCPRQLQGL